MQNVSLCASLPCTWKEAWPGLPEQAFSMGTGRRKPPGKPQVFLQPRTQTVPQLPPAQVFTGVSCFSCLLGTAVPFALGSLWCVAAAQETGQAVGRILVLSIPCCAFPGQTHCPWLCRGETPLSHSCELLVPPYSVAHTTQDSCPGNCLTIFITSGAKLRCYRALEALKIFCFLARLSVCVCV